MVPEREPHPELGEINNSIETLRQQWIADGLPDDQFWELYDEIFDRESMRNLPAEENDNRTRHWLYTAILALIPFVFAALVNYNFIRGITCSVQNYIYPVFRFIRKLFIPLICIYPVLSRLYYETCLVDNPFSSVTELDCWPCRSVKSVIENLSPKPVIKKSHVPFIYKTDQEVITPAKLKYFYMKNKHLFDEEAPLILIDNRTFVIPTDMISQQEAGAKHNYIWEFNNMNVARLLRQIVPRPVIVPKFGQSIERYLIVDTSHEAFLIPEGECNFSFLLALSGSRTIELYPIMECQYLCKSLKVELHETYLLWYNRWYWKPFVQHSTGNNTFIAHTGTYC